jgi:hypothetical protein
MTKTKYEGKIARDLRRGRELGEECLDSAKIEAERLVRSLGRALSFAEEALLDEVAYLRVRSKILRKWGLHSEADKATRLLDTLVKNFDKKFRSTVAEPWG